MNFSSWIILIIPFFSPVISQDQESAIGANNKEFYVKKINGENLIGEWEWSNDTELFEVKLSGFTKKMGDVTYDFVNAHFKYSVRGEIINEFEGVGGFNKDGILKIFITDKVSGKNGRVTMKLQNEDICKASWDLEEIETIYLGEGSSADFSIPKHVILNKKFK
ncbi:hypothetical protein [Leeuwenhoekiella sp. W20_SRS_FM14]|uniref:hypothetical protein n=1 Tax=Leeuwenhoekiella sp. W20_SRS_FM14 TaxID=3240270 RepID=UPI003F9DEF71